ncbi:hypothetical protein MC69_004750 [Aeromonas hydrophila]|nr:hypothetical protein MC69_004750 [Aeromonas hydrophila]
MQGGVLPAWLPHPAVNGAPHFHLLLPPQLIAMQMG